MPKAIVKYKNKRTLEALKDFAKYFDYEIELPGLPEKSGKQTNLKGLTIIPADNTVNTTGLSEVFTSKNVNASELRNEAWQRRK